MRAYMKSSMPFLGVGTPERRAVVRRLLASHPLDSAPRLHARVRELWRAARYREERYAAVDVLLAPRHRALLDLDALPLIEELVVTGAWWDFVDSLASHGLGELLRRHPREMKRILRAWSRDSNFWKRRAAILAQLGFKHETDVALLRSCIAPNLGDDEFFVQKAIGWALRQYAWSEPQSVRRYVAELGERLSPLSRREALKNLGTRKRRA